MPFAEQRTYASTLAQLLAPARKNERVHSPFPLRVGKYLLGWTRCPSRGGWPPRTLSWWKWRPLRRRERRNSVRQPLPGGNRSWARPASTGPNYPAPQNAPEGRPSALLHK